MATNQEPRMGLDVGKKTTQLNLWMVVSIVFFILISAILVTRLVHRPPVSTQEMKTGSFNHRYDGVWARAAC